MSQEDRLRQSPEVEVLEVREVERADALGYGLAAEELDEWRPFTAFEAHMARRRGIDTGTARRWLQHGFAMRDTLRALALGMVPDEAEPWTGRGFVPTDAIEAREVGVDIDTASAWREAGFTLPDALLLLDERWTLESATRARYADLGRTRRLTAS